MSEKEREQLINQLFNICLHFTNVEEGIEIYDLHPYIPYIPLNWNGILVLAEAQQLRKKNESNEDYESKLKKLDNRGKDQIKRLYSQTLLPLGNIGITPWDDGHIKLAMLSCFSGEKTDDFGISNAIPWHLNRNNKKQKEKYITIAEKYWRQIIPVLAENGLNVVIRTGTYARDLLDRKYLSEYINKEHIHYLRSASQLGRVSYLFKKDDLLKRYSEVSEAFKFTNNKWMKDSHVFYAAHAVSRIKNQI